MDKKFKVGETIYWYAEFSGFPEMNGWKSTTVQAVFDEDRVYGVYTTDLAENGEYPTMVDMIPFEDAYDKPQKDSENT